MTAMTVTHYGRESYTTRKAVDPDAHLEFEVRTYADGRQTVRVRRGEFALDRRWSAEFDLKAVSA